MAKKTRSDALKGVQVPSLELLLDDAMAMVPRLSFDLSIEENRTKLRNWIRMVASRSVHAQVLAATDATKRAIDEAGALYLDPAHYETKKKRRAETSERRVKREAERAAKVVPIEPKGMIM
jgi:hypothetical protein